MPLSIFVLAFCTANFAVTFHQYYEQLLSGADIKVIEEQAVFNWNMVKKLRAQLHSTNPGDAHAKVWALYVFQKWWINYMN